jgi:hypothetical protein
MARHTVCVINEYVGADTEQETEVSKDLASFGLKLFSKMKNLTSQKPVFHQIFEEIESTFVEKIAPSFALMSSIEMDLDGVEKQNVLLTIAEAGRAIVERAARRNPRPSGRGQASYQSSCGKELAAHFRSGESPSFEEGVLQ